MMSSWQLYDESGIPDLDPMDRSPGAHVSSGVRSLAISRGDFEDHGDGDFELPMVKTRMGKGSAYEAGLISMYTGLDPLRYFPGWEINIAGYHGTFDIIDAVNRRVIEVKDTAISSKNILGKPKPDTQDKLLKFEQQVAAYTYGMSDERLAQRVYQLRDSLAGPTEISRCRTSAEVCECLRNVRNAQLADRLELAVERLYEDGDEQPWRTAEVWILHNSGQYLFWLGKLGWGRYTKKQVEDDGPVFRKYRRKYSRSELVENWQRVVRAIEKDQK